MNLIFFLGVLGSLLGLAVLVLLVVRSKEPVGPFVDHRPQTNPNILDLRWEALGPDSGCQEHAACVRTYDFEGRLLSHRTHETVVPPL